MDYFRHHGLKRLTHWTFLGLHYPLYLLRSPGLISEVWFRTQWAAHLGWYLRGVSLAHSQPIWDYVVEQHLASHWRMDSRALLEEHRDAGDLVVLVSSGPAPLMRRIAAELGVEHAVGTEFEVQEGVFTGRHVGPVCIDGYKASLTLAYLRQRGLEVDLDASRAYADSTSDLPLLELVGHPVATYPDAALRVIAVARNWEIFPA